MKFYHAIIIAIVVLFTFPAFASEPTLRLLTKNKESNISIESLRQQADIEFTIFAPFRGREVQIRGLLLDTFFQKYLSTVPERFTLIAHDDYTLTFENWQPNHWILVTHEDGKPLSLRQHGPLRLVERDYGKRDPKNLRNFNDWIWMLKAIEVLP